MATDYEHPDHESVLLGVIALASLFSTCVEAFGLIHPSHKWEREEQLLLSRLGLQQARLLIWGDVLGISSPPKSVTDRAVPRHPSSAYPDLKEPTFFGLRDSRLDDPATRTAIEDAINAIVDRSAHLTREEMMEKYGLKPPKKLVPEYEQALDTNRLYAFREKYELLQEVAESYAHIDTRRSKSIVMQSWTITDTRRFANFIKLTQEKVDFLIQLMGVKDRVDRGMRMDIRGFGWHVTMDRAKTSQDVSKLRLLSENCKQEYPEYEVAIQQALDHINRETREAAGTGEYNPYAVPLPAAPVVQPKTTKSLAPPTSNGHLNTHAKAKRPGLMKLFKSFTRKSKENVHDEPPRSKSASGPSGVDADRSFSDAGPITEDFEDMAPLEPIRSKSLGEILLPASMDDEVMSNKLAQVHTAETVHEAPLTHTETLGAHISRHDQYRGIARTDTKDLQWRH